MSGRRMIYPYTLTAKFVNYDYKGVPSPIVIACLFSLFCVHKISKAYNTEGNRAARVKYDEVIRKEHEEHLEHLI